MSTASDFPERIDMARAAIEQADGLLIGAGAGLSTAAGLVYSGPRFTEHFAPFIARYGMTDMYSAGFHPFASDEERWGYWAQHIGVNRFDPPGLPLYRALADFVEPIDHFVLTTNVDHQFQKAGFDPDTVFAVQGDYGLMQCSVGCHDRLYDDQALVARMRAATIDCVIPSELVPHCPVCGGPMEPNLRKDEHFVQDPAWYEAQRRYHDFLDAHEDGDLVLLEIGVGFNTPGIIRFPFEQFVYTHPRARLVRINRDHPHGPVENRDRTIAFGEDTARVITALQC